MILPTFTVLGTVSSLIGMWLDLISWRLLTLFQSFKMGPDHYQYRILEEAAAKRKLGVTKTRKFSLRTCSCWYSLVVLVCSTTFCNLFALRGERNASSRGSLQERLAIFWHGRNHLRRCFEPRRLVQRKVRESVNHKEK